MRYIKVNFSQLFKKPTELYVKGSEVDPKFQFTTPEETLTCAQGAFCVTVDKTSKFVKEVQFSISLKEFYSFLLLTDTKKATIGGTVKDDKKRAIVFSYDSTEAWTYIASTVPSACPAGHPCTTPLGIKVNGKDVANTPVEMPGTPTKVCLLYICQQFFSCNKIFLNSLPLKHRMLGEQFT